MSGLRLASLNRGSLVLILGLLSGCGAPAPPEKRSAQASPPPVTAAGVPTDASALDPAVRAQLKAEAAHLYAEFRRVRVPCGSAARGVEHALTVSKRDFDPTLAALAERAQQTCRDTFVEFGALPIPSAADAVLRDRYGAAVEDCMKSAKAIESALFDVASGAGSGELQQQKDAALGGLSDAHRVAQSCSQGLQTVVKASAGDA